MRIKHISDNGIPWENEVLGTRGVSHEVIIDATKEEKRALYNLLKLIDDEQIRDTGGHEDFLHVMDKIKAQVDSEEGLLSFDFELYEILSKLPRDLQEDLVCETYGFDRSLYLGLRSDIKRMNGDVDAYIKSGDPR